MLVLISLGSNIDAKKTLKSALRQIKEKHPELQISPMYQTKAIGFEGDDFLNCVAKFETQQPVETISRWFRQIETDYGRDRTKAKFSSRTLDIDLLTYGNEIIKKEGLELPRDEIEKYAFVLKPLADLVPDELYPINGKSYMQLWKNFDAKEQKLSKVNFKY